MNKPMIVAILVFLYLLFPTPGVYCDDTQTNTEPNENQATQPVEENPITALEESSIKPRAADEIISLSNEFYSEFTKGKETRFPNKNMERMHKFAITYDLLNVKFPN
jgi:hypothetical protein